MSFLKKLFGGKKSDLSGGAEDIIRDTLDGIIDRGAFEISYEISSSKEGDGGSLVNINFSGPDEELFKDKKGHLLDSVQLILKRVLQHNLPEDRTQILLDSNGFREETEQALIERAENLKMIAIEQGKSVYYRALPPKERKVVHQYLAKDPRVKSRSLGDGLYKKIKIYPAKDNGAESESFQD